LEKLERSLEKLERYRFSVAKQHNQILMATIMDYFHSYMLLNKGKR